MRYSSLFTTRLYRIGIGLILIPTLLCSQFNDQEPYLKVLGTVQDGGSPHIGCEKNCCNTLSSHEKEKRQVTSLAVILPQSKSSLLFEATPDIISQWSELKGTSPSIFLTHAHMGHYSGLMQLGREALGAKDIPVYAMPKMKTYLIENGPWSQLVSLKNIRLISLEEKRTISPVKQIKVTPIQVPHRDEFSETVGYRINGPHKSVLFIPDIDKWSKWDSNLMEELKKVDYAFIDATFFDAEEINHRQISEIPHPLVKETILYLSSASIKIKNKVYFIHMNHTNPLLDLNSDATKWITEQGYHVAQKGHQFNL